ncbi:iron-siderophore ABC transporter substrate-binding protein [Scatolibacter rhodanostii]|uniref:iron-siderophore ABC transporter substrate-binding protein n=1 Tax=Scatolibacter rhodanostii TaxID=2014781 RepID=UPI000C089D63|nr:iron-siderophore ABC transporter substrate-binding protein [Scatolibacter rhodanostii]
MKVKKISAAIMALVMSVGVLSACSTEKPAEESSVVSESKTSETSAVSEGTDSSAAESTDSTATYPMTIKHALGEIVIEKQPERIATIGWGNHDVPLALGVVPVGISKANFGPVDENGLLSWTAAAYKELGVENPVVFDDVDGLDYEAISDTNPDIILAAYSGITQEEYDLLSEIAPVVAYPEYPWQTYWRDQTLLNAKGMGKEEEAKKLVAETEEMIKTKTAAYESLKGKTAAFFYFDASNFGTFYIYLPTDPRASFLMDLGLTFPQSVLDLADDETAFSLTMSSENIDSLKDIDIIVCYGNDDVLKAMQADPLVGQIPAVANGAMVMLDETSDLSASTTSSVLSIQATLDEYLEVLNKAAENVK